MLLLSCVCCYWTTVIYNQQQWFLWQWKLHEYDMLMGDLMSRCLVSSMLHTPCYIYTHTRIYTMYTTIYMYNMYVCRIYIKLELYNYTYVYCVCAQPLHGTSACHARICTVPAGSNDHVIPTATCARVHVFMHPIWLCWPGRHWYVPTS